MNAFSSYFSLNEFVMNPMHANGTNTIASTTTIKLYTKLTATFSNVRFTSRFL